MAKKKSRMDSATETVAEEINRMRKALKDGQRK
jgi:hypothetical protein